VLVFVTENVSQHPFQIGILIRVLILLNSSTAAGVEIIVLEGMVVPSNAKATEIGPTVSPVGTAMLAPNSAK
jgi:hypothetical protein